MPNIKSAKKRLKVSARQTELNRTTKSRVATARRRMLETIAGGDKAAAETAYRNYCSMLDKAVKKGVLKANSANRSKARGDRRLAAIS